MIPGEALMGWSCVCKKCFAAHNGLIKILRDVKGWDRNRCVYCGEKVEDELRDAL